MCIKLLKDYRPKLAGEEDEEEEGEGDKGEGVKVAGEAHTLVFTVVHDVGYCLLNVLVDRGGDTRDVLDWVCCLSAVAHGMSCAHATGLPRTCAACVTLGRTCPCTQHCGWGSCLSALGKAVRLSAAVLPWPALLHQSKPG